MKDLCVETAELAKTLTTGCNPVVDLDLDSLFSNETSALTDTLKAATNDYNFSEVCPSPPSAATLMKQPRKFGEHLLCLASPCFLITQLFLLKSSFSSSIPYRTE